LLPVGVCRQLAPGSDVIAELMLPAPDCRTRFVSFWSDLDGLISPKSAAQIAHPDLVARNVFVRGVGHMSLPVDRRVTREIVATLAQLDSDGSTLRAGLGHIDTAAPAAENGRSRGRRAGVRGRAANQ
jgi:hypothetical protein